MKYLAVVALLLAGCFASLCEAEEPLKLFTPEVGKEYELVAEGKVPLMVLYGIEVDSFLKLLGARDMVGITSMVKARRAGVMPEGHTIRVLELTKASMFQKYGYAECRLQKGDVDAGKWCIPLLFFQKTHLTPATK